MLRSLVLLGLAVTLGFSGAARAEDIKLGYVDLQRALAETEEGRKARAVLKKDFDQKQKEIDEQQEQLKKAMDDLEKKRTLLPAATVQQKERELASQMQKVQQVYLRHQQDLQKKEGEATGKILERMQRIIGKIAGAENLTLVLEKNNGGVLFAKQHLDYTNEVIRRYNAGEGQATGAKAAAKPGAAPAKPSAAKK